MRLNDGSKLTVVGMVGCAYAVGFWVNFSSDSTSSKFRFDPEPNSADFSSEPTARPTVLTIYLSLSEPRLEVESPDESTLPSFYLANRFRGDS